jgi:hypothetical protein
VPGVVNAANEGVFAGEAHIRQPVKLGDILPGIEALDGESRGGDETLSPLRGLRCLPFPLYLPLSNLIKLLLV